MKLANFFHRNPGAIHCADVMTREVAIIYAHDLVADAAKKMRQYNVGCLPVCENGKVMGMITDRDIVLRVNFQTYNPKEVLVSDVMTKGIIMCKYDTPLAEAARLMNHHRVRRVVIDNDDGTIGLISIGDICRHLPQVYFNSHEPDLATAAFVG